MLILAKDDREFLAGITVTHEKVGHTNQGLWHHKGMQLPAYIQHIANDLRENGMETSRAIATAISRCKVWCAGGGGVKPDTKAKACAAIAEWEKLKTQAAAATPSPGDSGSKSGLPALVTIPDVELLAAGTWQLSTGRQTFTRDDLSAAVEAAKCPSVGAPVIKIGHLDDRFRPQDGEPALGRVSNLRLSKNGMKIIGDLAGMPGWLAAVSASAFPRRSVEGTYNFQCQIGHEHPFVVTALALLGVTQPGVGVLTDLNDLANLFYRASDGPQAGEAWRTGPIEQIGVPMPVTEEDVRRAYYAAGNVPQSWWITELQMSPSQLIVTDGEGKVYRVPFAIEGSAVNFGEAAEMSSYSDLAASRGTGPVVVFASADESRDVGAAGNSGDGKDQGQGAGADGDGLDSSWDGDLSDLPDLHGLMMSHFDAMHNEMTGQQAAAEDVAALAKLGTGARFKALSKALAAKGATNPGALAAWIGRKKYGKAAFVKLASAARKKHASAEASADHEPYTGEHSHAHPAFGSQGSDETHRHGHSHKSDAEHNHAHASAGTTENGGLDVIFTEEQTAALRASLGLADDEELTPERVMDGLKAIKARAAAGSRQLPQGVIAVDQERWDALNSRVKNAEEYQKRQQVKERDQVIASAIRDGKFSAARKPHWVRLWDNDPDGTREVLAGLQKNVIPVDDIGSPGGADEELLDDEYKALFPPGSVRS